jgi:plastocyanin
MSSALNRDDRSVLLWGAFGVAVAAFFIAIVSLTGLSSDESASGEGGGGAAAGPTVIDVQLSEFAITPAAIVAPPGPVQLRITNVGSVVHNLSVPTLGVISKDLLGGESETLDLGTLSEGVMDVLCEIPGHAGSGMIATLSITSGAAPSPSNTGDDGLHGFANWQEMDAAMELRAKAFPADTMGDFGGRVMEPEIEADGTKVFRLVAQKVDWEVEPGKIVKARPTTGSCPDQRSA